MGNLPTDMKRLSADEVKALRDPFKLICPQKMIDAGFTQTRYTIMMRNLPSSHRLKVHRAYSEPQSRSNVIKAKCLECVGFEDIIRRVGGCTAWQCPLWSARPYQEQIAQAKASGTLDIADETLDDADPDFSP